VFFDVWENLLDREVGPLQGHRTKHRKTRTNAHDLSEIQTHDPGNKAAKSHALDREVIVTTDLSSPRNLF
jgi:hypothetical protein